MDNSAKTPVLTIRNLTKHLSGRLILDNINLDVYPGEIFGFLGPNGSGKTTTIKIMLGLLSLESGSISICGKDIVKEFEEAVSNVGGIIENPEMYKYLTGRENLEQYARMYENVSKERIDELVELVGLKTRINDKISRYSLGMRQRLGVAQALLNKPALLVLDEPTNGLDPQGIKELRDILKEIAAKENVAVFVSSHLLAEIELMCDRVGVIDKGRVIGSKRMDEIRGDFGDGKEHFDITVGNPDMAASVFAARNISFTREKDTFRISLLHSELPSLVKELAAADSEIFEVVKIKKSLEDAFLEMVLGPNRQGRREVGIGGFEMPANNTPSAQNYVGGGL